MKTLLFAPCYLDEGDRLQRNLKWLKYYKDLKGNLKYDDILLVDNASSISSLQELKKDHSDIRVLESKVHLSRLTEHAYGYWFKAFRKGISYALNNGYDKIIHCDSDVFILKQELVDYVNSINSGWNCLYCSMYDYPETTFQIIGKDKFEEAYDFFLDGFLKFYPYKIAETEIPFTHVEKGFIGDRYGELNKPQTLEMAWYGQCLVTTPMTFEMK